MRKTMLLAAALLSAGGTALLAQASAHQASGQTKPSPLAPGEIVANAPKTDWTAIAPSDLLVMDLAPDAKGRPRRVVIQLMPPPFSQGWIGNIRKLAAAHWWDGLAVNRVQDNYVVQWGDPDADDPAKARKLPDGLERVPESAYEVPANWRSQSVQIGEIACPASSLRAGPVVLCTRGVTFKRLFPQVTGSSAPTNRVTFSGGFPVEIARSSSKQKKMSVWPVHCYGMIGVGRDLPPNTGNGAELYTVIGQAPRHLDRNIALVGRVIEGMEFLSSLPRGHGALGFYDTAQGDERTGIISIRLGTEVKDLPAYEYLSTESDSFARYVDARANRRDAFFIRPAGGADICNVPVPVRRVP